MPIRGVWLQTPSINWVSRVTASFGVTSLLGYHTYIITSGAIRRKLLDCWRGGGHTKKTFIFTATRTFVSRDPPPLNIILMRVEPRYWIVDDWLFLKILDARFCFNSWMKDVFLTVAHHNDKYHIIHLLFTTHD